MKQSDKQRLTVLTRDAVASISGGPAKVREYAAKVAARFSPTNANQYRKLAEIVWWLIAVERDRDAMRVMDALCELDDEYYWMFHALASAYATRAWLHTKQKQPTAAREDARTALHWIQRDPNPKAITESEVRGALGRVDTWLDRAANERGTMTALQVLSHALRVLVMYQQFAKAGDPAAKAIPSREYTSRMNLGVRELRRRIESW
jgi:hypothetical protein